MCYRDQRMWLYRGVPNDRVHSLGKSLGLPPADWIYQKNSHRIYTQKQKLQDPENQEMITKTLNF